VSWPAVRLGDLCSVITKGTTPRTLGREYAFSGVPFLRAENLNNGEIVLDRDTLFIDVSTDELLARSRISPGDVLISIAGTIGRTAIVPADSPRMNCNQAVAIVRISGPLEPRFLLHWLKTEDAQRQVSGMQVTATISNLSLGQIKELRLPLPALSEQKRIVDILDKASAILREREEANVMTSRIMSVLFAEMFGDPSSNPRHWPVQELGQLISIGPQNGMYKPTTEYGSGTPIVRIDSFYDGTLLPDHSLKRLQLSPTEVATYELKPNDILINRVNSPDFLGKSALIEGFDEPTVFESNMMRLAVDNSVVSPVYIIHLLQTRAAKSFFLQRSKRAVNQASINQDDVRSLPVPIPPNNLQLEFARRSSGVAAITKQQRVATESIGDLFDVLLHRAFSGSLTAEWRRSRRQELLAEVEGQSRLLLGLATNDTASA
jgi:type I restriction enzyme S subunit